MKQPGSKNLWVIINTILMRNLLLVLVALQLFLPRLAAQEWVVPDDKKGKLSTFPFDDATRKAGEKLYSVNCMSCHGTPGKANFLKLVPPPGDPATEKIQKNTDGQIFYKVTTGRGQMPSFKSVLTSNELWNIISYIRSFNVNYKQQVMQVITSSAYPGAEIKLALSYNTSDSSVVLNATASKENTVVPVTGAEVRLYVQRTFGHLAIDEAKTTNDKGAATFRIPHDLPGDTAGNIMVSARFSDEETFGSVSKDTVLRAGTKTIPVSLTAQRAMWNNVRKAPIWVLLSYVTGVLVAWGFIIYVLLKIRDIFIIGATLSADLTEKER
jgi:mono/diheme cytochrome c family protein